MTSRWAGRVSWNSCARWITRTARRCSTRGRLALHGDDLYTCAKALAPFMVQTTLADYQRLPRYSYLPGLVNYQSQPAMVRAVPLGEGILDLPAFFRRLKAGGFTGYVAYEMCSPLRGGGSEANLDATAKRSLAVLQALLAGKE